MSVALSRRTVIAFGAGATVAFVGAFTLQARGEAPAPPRSALVVEQVDSVPEPAPVTLSGVARLPEIEPPRRSRPQSPARPAPPPPPAPAPASPQAPVPPPPAPTPAPPPPPPPPATAPPAPPPPAPPPAPPRQTFDSEG